jgi:peptidoglycan hydrolase FlgJ
LNLLSAISSAVTGKETPPNPLAAAGKGGDAKKTEDELHKAFQTFVAGTFYKQMLKSLRKMEKKPAYFYGGQAEEIFRGQMDQEVSESLAKRQGDALVGTLYQSFAQRLRPDLAKALAKPKSATTTAPARN